VDDEQGVRGTVVVRGDHVNGSTFVRARGTLDIGMPLPLPHSSIWLLGAAGASPQDRSEPFANFYFGGFGNNYVDSRDEKRYREYQAFPGAGINALSGRTFAKGTAEWNLPPLRFSRLGTPGFYASWLRPAVFASLLGTNLDAAAVRQTQTSVGAQLDLRMTVLNTVDLTLSGGAAVLRRPDGSTRRELMASLTLLR
jgi:hypothetical protein